MVDGGANERAHLTSWDVSSGQAVGEARTDIPYFAANGLYEIDRVGNSITLHDLRDGSTRSLFTGGVIPSVSPDGQRLIWITRAGDNVPGQGSVPTTVWMSDIDGQNGQVVLSDAGISAQWLDSEHLLIGKSGAGRTRQLTVLSVSDGSSYVLGSWTNMRDLRIAPGGQRLAFYLSFQEDPAANGVYVVEITPDAQAQQLPWFGSYRWRDSGSLYYIPFDPGSDLHSLHYYNVSSGEDRAVTDPAALPFTIMNGDWEVSADGRRIVFQDARTRAMSLLEMTD